MKIDYIRENSGNYMQIVGEAEDDFAMKMLCNNHVENLLDVSSRQINNNKIYLYNITGKNNLEELYEKRKMNSNELNGFINCVKNAVEGIGKFLISDEGFVFNPKCIYTDGNQFYFTYFSQEKMDLWDNLKNIFEYIIGIINHNDNDAVTIGYGIYKRLCTERTSLNELFKYEVSSKVSKPEVLSEVKTDAQIIPEIRSEETEVPDKIKLYGVYTCFGILGVFEVIFFLFLINTKLRPKSFGQYICIGLLLIDAIAMYGLYTWFKKNKYSFYKIIKKEVVVPYEREHVRVTLAEKKQENLTTILNTNCSKHCLEWYEKGTLRKFDIEDDIVIGSSFEHADLVINETGVSRTHAKLIKEDDIIYIKDINSTNGTIVQNTMLASYQMLQLHPGDRIEIGNISMLFH